MRGAFFHAKDIIKPDLFFPPLHQKTVGVKQQDDRENTNDDRTEMQNGDQGFTAPDREQTVIFPERIQNEEHGDRKDAGKHIRDIRLAVLL